MKIEQFHEWIGYDNRFDVTIYNLSNALGNGGTSGDLGPFYAKNTDFLFLIKYAGRKYNPVDESYTYEYIKKIEKYDEGFCLFTEKFFNYYDDIQPIYIKQEIFIKKLCKHT